MLFLSLLQQVSLFLSCLTVAYLGLQVLNLLLQEIVLLLLVQVFTGLVADIGLQMLQVDFAVQHLHYREQSFFNGLGLQQRHLLLDAEWHV